MLEIKNVTRCFSKKEIIEEISMTVGPGEIHGLIGVNSAGKTTLMRCIIGILKVNKGRIALDGEEIFENPDAKRRIGYVSAGYEYPMNMTVRELGKMYQDLYPDFDKARFHELLKVFAIEHANYISGLSTGEQMRLRIAVNFARECDYLLLDEPTLGLDAIGRETFYRIMVEKAEQNVGILLSSHDMEQLETVCDYIHFMENGRLIFQEPTETLLARFSKAQVILSEEQAKQLAQNPKILDVSGVGSVYHVFAHETAENLKSLLVSSVTADSIDNIELLPVHLDELFCKYELVK